MDAAIQEAMSGIEQSEAGQAAMTAATTILDAAAKVAVTATTMTMTSSSSSSSEQQQQQQQSDQLETEQSGDSTPWNEEPSIEQQQADTSLVEDESVLEKTTPEQADANTEIPSEEQPAVGAEETSNDIAGDKPPLSSELEQAIDDAANAVVSASASALQHPLLLHQKIVVGDDDTSCVTLAETQLDHLQTLLTQAETQAGTTEDDVLTSLVHTALLEDPTAAVNILDQTTPDNILDILGFAEQPSKKKKRGVVPRRATTTPPKQQPEETAVAADVAVEEEKKGEPEQKESDNSPNPGSSMNSEEKMAEPDHTNNPDAKTENENDVGTPEETVASEQDPETDNSSNISAAAIDTEIEADAEPKGEGKAEAVAPEQDKASDRSSTPLPPTSNTKEEAETESMAFFSVDEEREVTASVSDSFVQQTGLLLSDLKAQVAKLRADYDRVNTNNKRLSQANDDAIESFETLHKHSQGVQQKWDESQVVLRESQVVLYEVRDELQMKDASYGAEVRTRLSYQKALQQVADLVQSQCQDSGLVEQVLGIADKVDAEAMSTSVVPSMTGTSGTGTEESETNSVTASGSFVMTDTSGTEETPVIHNKSSLAAACNTNHQPGYMSSFFKACTWST